ncbi:MAG: hypothetical protein MJY86_02935 [Bacteroidales bacterium]|nr:hypothetical protein [Candidatus Cryptobacteroides faecihippi]MCQ2162210.1 hypothetical protein [Bacteroidales bacterium]
MKRQISLTITAIMLFLASTVLGAQDKCKENCQNGGWKERVKIEKIAFLTDAVGLTSAEAEKFWPIYNKCEEEKRHAFKEGMAIYRQLQEAIESNKSDKEIASLLDKYLKSQEAGIEIDRKYIAEYRKVLSGEKVAKLFLGEESFRRHQFSKLKKKD